MYTHLKKTRFTRSIKITDSILHMQNIRKGGDANIRLQNSVYIILVNLDSVLCMQKKTYFYL